MNPETSELRLTSRPREDVVVVEVRGRLGLATYQQLRDHLFKVAADCPSAVVVNLADLVVDSAASLAIFSTVHTRLTQWPGVPMLLVAGDQRSRDLVRCNRVARFVPVHDTVAAAIGAIDEPPPRRVTTTRLTNLRNGPRTARAFARHVCAAWDVTRITEEVAVLTNELVTNAIVHTSSEPRLRLELRRELFSVAVYDDEPGEVAVRDPGGAAVGVHGLLLVAQIATAWGCSPTADGGKVVWATLRTC
jgi:anti-anti-sigma factor